MLKTLREKAGLKSYEAAVKLGVHPMTISRWENGHSAPTVDQLSKIREVYNLTDSEVLALLKEAS